MHRLYHHWLCPFSRKVRIVLAEKKLPFELVVESVWEKRPEFIAMNPANDVPVLVEPDGTVLADSAAIVEYLDERHPEPALLGANLHIRAEVRRLVGWFDVKFNGEVTINLVGQKVVRRQMGLSGSPDSNAVRSGFAHLGNHLAYLGRLADERRWLAGDHFSLADIAAAAHLSTVDYMGDIAWDEHPPVKDWYVRVKSRPSFRPLLADQLPGVRPPPHYADLDF
jgi:glutathione S-transferase